MTDTERIAEKVKEFLTALGYGAIGDIEPLIIIASKYAVRWALDNCNLDELPEELYPLTTRMAAGELLSTLKGVGRLTGFDIDLEAAAKSITEGDVSVTLAIGDGCLTPEQRVDALIAALKQPDRSSLTRYRRLVW